MGLTGIYRIEPSPEGMKTISGAMEIARSYSDYLRDESLVHAPGIEKLFFPRSPENIAHVMALAGERGKSVTVSGGRTGICAGAVPREGGYLLSLEKMSRILGIERRGEELTLTAEGGLRLSELNQKIASRELGLDGSAAEEFTSSKAAFFYPPDPTEQTASLGGTVATNASGARTLFFGPTREYVVALDLVLASGELLRVRRGEITERRGVFSVHRDSGGDLLIPVPTYGMPSTKNSAGLYSRAGMDLIDLFIGSEGILGVIVNVTVRLIEEPRALIGGVAFFPGEAEAVVFVGRSRASGVRPLALEYFDEGALRLLETTRREQGPTSEIPEIGEAGTAVYFESALFGDGRSAQDIAGHLRAWRALIEECGGNPRLAWGAVTKRDILRLKTFRHALPEAVNKVVSGNKLKDNRIHKVGTDMAVPDGRLEEMMGCYRSLLGNSALEHVVFGHIGNNHVHVNMLPKSHGELLAAKELYRTFAKKAVSLGGSVSAEHGIGKLKKEYLVLQYPESAFEEMRAIKRALDPMGILNPGDVV